MYKKILLTFFALMFVLSLSGNSYSVEVTALMSEAFQDGKVIVMGEGVASLKAKGGKARLMALRAAKADAYRKLLEFVQGVSLTGENTISDQVDIKTKVQGIVRGAVEVKSDYDDGVGLVYLELAITGEDSLSSQLLPQLITTDSVNRFSSTMKFEEGKSFDGLIVNVQGTEFKPALLNNILTKDGKVVYEPSVVSPSVLALRGAAEYTNDIGKAKAALEERGSKNPLIVNGESIVNVTDVVVSLDSANSIISSNKDGNFLESAKVVFVLD